MAPGALLTKNDSPPASIHDNDSFTIEPGPIPAAHPTSLLNRNVRTASLLLKRAEGNWRWIADDRGTWKIFDGSGGAAVSSIDPREPRVRDAILQQYDTGVVYAPGGFETDIAKEFAQFLIRTTDNKMSKAVFYSSGSEAVEGAIKVGRQYHAQEKSNPEPSRHLYIARERSYHGATLGALDVSGHFDRKEIYDLILPNNTVFVPPCNPYRDMKVGETEPQYVARLAEVLDRKIRDLGPENVAGFFAEPIVGAALGCMPALPGYLTAMKKVCRRHGVLFILDEVMCGMGRTGYIHAWQQENVVPDIQLVGKCLGGGHTAISAMLVSQEIYDAFVDGPGTGIFNHGHTFQNFPLACAAGLAVQRIVLEDGLLANVRDKGEKLMTKLVCRLGTHPHVGNIRGAGLFRGIEFVADKATKEPFPSDEHVAGNIHALGLTREYGIYVYPGTGSADGRRGDHILLAPAFNVTDEELDLLVDRVATLVEDYFKAMAMPNV